MDTRLVKEIINQYIDFRKLLERDGTKIAPNGGLFCPFHHNTNSKAAHFYENEGGGVIYCFAEHQVFAPYDYYTLLHPDFKVEELAKVIYEKLDNLEKAFIGAQVNTEKELPTLPYIDALKKFKDSEITYNDLLDEINNHTLSDGGNAFIDEIFKLQPLPLDSLDFLNSKYIKFMKEGNTPYKVLFANNIVRGVDNLPDYLSTYLSLADFHVVLPNIIRGRIHNVTFRTLDGRKQFLKCGDSMYLPYNLGGIDNNFRYGMPILLVEGSIDCDVIKKIYPYTIASMTAMLSTNQIQLLEHLTNTIIVAYDNDSAGMQGYNILRHKLKDFNVHKLNHYGKLKDFGDLIDLRYKDREEYEYIISSYKKQLETYLK